jgi:hypothetical protein
MVETSTHTAVAEKPKQREQDTYRWIAEDEFSNIILEAFKDGEKKGKKKAIKAMVDAYIRDYEIAKKIYEAFLHTLLSNKIKCHSIRVKIGAFRCFDALIIISAKDYYSDNYAKILELSKAFTNHPTPNINLNYRFMPYSSKINFDELESDGFIGSYQPIHEQSTPTRPAQRARKQTPKD